MSKPKAEQLQHNGFHTLWHGHWGGGTIALGITIMWGEKGCTWFSSVWDIRRRTCPGLWNHPKHSHSLVQWLSQSMQCTVGVVLSFPKCLNWRRNNSYLIYFTLCGRAIWGGNCRQIIWGFNTVDITRTKMRLCGLGIGMIGGEKGRMHFPSVWCFQCQSHPEPLKQVKILCLLHCNFHFHYWFNAQSESFAHFLNALTEGGTTPSLFIAHFMGCVTTSLSSAAR